MRDGRYGVGHHHSRTFCFFLHVLFVFFDAFLSRRDERVMMSSSDTQCKLRTVL